MGVCRPLGPGCHNLQCGLRLSIGRDLDSRNCKCGLITVQRAPLHRGLDSVWVYCPGRAASVRRHGWLLTLGGLINYRDGG